MTEDLLLMRKRVKARKPRFLRQDAHKVGTLAKKWRAPKGMHSKMREQRHGFRRHPSIGWSSPKAVRGLTPQGHRVIVIYTENELMKVKSPVVLASHLGTKKRVALVKMAKDLGVKILNVKDPDHYLKSVAEAMALRREEKKARGMKKKKTLEESKKKEETKPQETPEEREKREKEEKKRVLEQR